MILCPANYNNLFYLLMFFNGFPRIEALDAEKIDYLVVLSNELNVSSFFLFFLELSFYEN